MTIIVGEDELFRPLELPVSKAGEPAVAVAIDDVPTFASMKEVIAYLQKDRGLLTECLPSSEYGNFVKIIKADNFYILNRFY